MALRFSLGGALDSAVWQRNLSLYVRQRAYTSFLTYIPISLVFYLQSGLGIGEIGILNSVTAAVLLAVDLPSGYAADRSQHKRLLVGGIVIQGAGFALMGALPVFWLLVVAHVLLGFGEACRRSADDAIARQSAVLLGQPELFGLRYAPRGVVAMGLAEGTAALVVAGLAWWLGPVAARVAVLLQVVVFARAAIIASRMVQPPPLTAEARAERRQPLMRVVINHTRAFSRTVRDEMSHNPKARWLIFYGAAIGCTTKTVVYLVQPYFRESQLPLWAYALAWAPYHFAWAAFAWYAGTYVRWLGRRRALLSLVLLGVIGNVAMVELSNSAGLIALTTFYFIRGVQMPTILAWMGDIVRQDRLATMLSLHTSVYWGMFVVMNLILGYVTEAAGTRGAFIVSAVVYACLGLVFVSLLVREDRRDS